ncbi:MAG: hypothetical protein LBJ41_01860 [Treponema sp.]|jgi:hypothetical protein|nr:hypothetical protein [Treponema sp.]
MPEMIAEFNAVENHVNLRCTNAGVRITEVFGLIAGALGFGGGGPFTSYGSYFFDFITDDSTISITPANVMSAGTTAQLMGGYRNTETGVIINGSLIGVDYAINVKKMSPLFEQVVTGSELVFIDNGRGSDADFIPLTGVRIPKSVRMEMYNLRDRHATEGTTDVGDIEGLVAEHVYSGAVIVADDSRGAVSLDSFNFTLQARVYQDDAGNNIGQPEKLYRGPEDPFFKCLTVALENRPLISMLTATPATSIIVQTPMTINANTGGNENNVIVIPAAASGYTVEITEPMQSPLGCKFAYDDAAKRIRITAESTKGNESVTVKLTNADGTTQSATLALTVV